MALKITTQIGTDKGITSEAYVRISDYQVSKNGTAFFKIQLFQEEPEKVQSIYAPVIDTTSKNQEIGDTLLVKLIKEIEEEDGTIKVLADLSPLEDTTIFEFAYSKLKEKLSASFGAENIVDC